MLLREQARYRGPLGCLPIPMVRPMTLAESAPPPLIAQGADAELRIEGPGVRSACRKKKRGNPASSAQQFTCSCRGGAQLEARSRRQPPVHGTHMHSSSVHREGIRSYHRGLKTHTRFNAARTRNVEGSNGPGPPARSNGGPGLKAVAANLGFPSAAASVPVLAGPAKERLGLRIARKVPVK